MYTFTFLCTAVFILSEKNSQTAGSESLCSGKGMPSISGTSLSKLYTSKYNDTFLYANRNLTVTCLPQVKTLQFLVECGRVSCS